MDVAISIQSGYDNPKNVIGNREKIAVKLNPVMVVNFLTKMWYPPTYICPDQTDNMTAEVRFNNILKRRTKEFEALKIQSSIVVISTKRESEKSRNVYFLNRDYSPQHDVELQSNSGEYSHRNPNCEPGTHCTCEIKQTLKF